MNRSLSSESVEYAVDHHREPKMQQISSLSLLALYWITVFMSNLYINGAEMDERVGFQSAHVRNATSSRRQNINAAFTAFKMLSVAEVTAR
jgi:hypothetical protein